MSCKKLHDATALSGTVQLAIESDSSLVEHISLCQDCRRFYEEELALDQMILDAAPPLPGQLPALKKPGRRWLHPAWGIAAMIFVAAFLTWNINRNPDQASIIAEQEEIHREETLQTSSPATPETHRDNLISDKGKTEVEPETLQEISPRLQQNKETPKKQLVPTKQVHQDTNEEKTAATSEFDDATPPPTPKTEPRKMSKPSVKPGSSTISGGVRVKKNKAEAVQESPLEEHIYPDEEATPAVERAKKLTFKSKRSPKTQAPRTSVETAENRMVQNAMEVKDSVETQADETKHDIVQTYKEEREHLLLTVRVHSDGEVHAPGLKYFILTPEPTKRVFVTVTGFISGHHPELKLNQDVMFGLNFPLSPGHIRLNLIRTGHPGQPLEFFSVDY